MDIRLVVNLLIIPIKKGIDIQKYRLNARSV